MTDNNSSGVVIIINKRHNRTTTTQVQDQQLNQIQQIIHTTINHTRERDNITSIKYHRETQEEGKERDGQAFFIPISSH